MKSKLYKLCVLCIFFLPAYVYADVVQLIKRNASGFAFDGGNGSANTQDVYLWDADSSNVNQLWNEIDRGDGYFSYQKFGTNHCIDGNNGGARSQNVYLWSCADNNFNQHWLKLDVGNGYYRLQKRNAPAFSLDGQGGGENGQSVYLWNNGNSNQNQHWFFNYQSGEDTPPSTEEAAAFLMQSTFGPTESSIAELMRMGYSAWFRNQFNQPIVDLVEETRALGEGLSSNLTFNYHSLEAFYQQAAEGSDQLRQRAAFALSEIFVTSTIPNPIIRKSLLHASYKDIIQRGAFGNFRDLIEEVTYHPLMGFWLTYAGNQKANPETGSAPDENYAREILQLFTIGLTELNNNGSVRIANGAAIETYDNDDITELAKIFTGLYWANKEFGGRVSLHTEEESDTERMEMHDEYHSEGAKFFLGGRVNDLGDGNAEISAALDIIFAHSNVAPFICTQLIQRLTFSNPHGTGYTTRCVNAFNSGEFTLPDGTLVGTGERGDLAPVWAAILLDDTARDPNRSNVADYGKAREPIIGLIHWARVSDVNNFDVNETGLRGTLGDDDFGQTPYQSPSVFNFFRPGYIPVGTSMGDLNKVAPEFQIFTPTTLINYANTMRGFTTRASDAVGFAPQYTQELALADDPEALTDHLNLVMTAGRMDEDTLQGIQDTIAAIDLPNTNQGRQEALRTRVSLAMLLAVTSSEFRSQH